MTLKYIQIRNKISNTLEHEISVSVEKFKQLVTAASISAGFFLVDFSRSTQKYFLGGGKKWWNFILSIWNIEDNLSLLKFWCKNVKFQKPRRGRGPLWPSPSDAHVHQLFSWMAYVLSFPTSWITRCLVSCLIDG